MVAAEIVEEEVESTEDKCHKAAKGLAKSLVLWVET